MQHILLLVTYHTKPNTRETFVEEVTDLGILQNNITISKAPDNKSGAVSKCFVGHNSCEDQPQW